MHLGAATSFARAMHLSGLVTFSSRGLREDFAITLDQSGDFGAHFIAYNERERAGTSLLIAQVAAPVNNRPVTPADIASSFYAAVQFSEDTADAEGCLRGAPKPTALLAAGPDTFAVWKLSKPVQGKEVAEISKKIAAHLGGHSALFVPLPGTHRGRHRVKLEHHLKHLAYEAEALMSSARAAANAPLARASQISVKPVKWVYPGMIAEGHFVMVIGEPGVGKSQLVMDFAARLTSGRDWPDGTPNGQVGDVAFFEAEDDLSVTIARAEAAGADFDRLLLPEADEDGHVIERDLSTPAGVAEIERELSQMDNPRMLVLSPIRMFFGEKEASRQVDTRKRLASLLAMAARRRIAIIGVGHKVAGKGGRSAEEAAGPQAYAQRARSVLAAVIDESDPIFKKNPKLARRKLVSAKANNTADNFDMAYRIVAASTASGEGTSKVEWLDLGPELRAAPAQQSGNVLALPSPLEPAREWLRKRLADGPVEAAAIEAERKRLGYGRQTVYDAADKLQVLHGKSNTFPATSTWWLPE